MFALVKKKFSSLSLIFLLISCRSLFAMDLLGNSGVSVTPTTNSDPTSLLDNSGVSNSSGNQTNTNNGNNQNSNTTSLVSGSSGQLQNPADLNKDDTNTNDLTQAEQAAQISLLQATIPKTNSQNIALGVITSPNASVSEKGSVIANRHTTPGQYIQGKQTAGALQMTFQNKKDSPPLAHLTSSLSQSTYVAVKQTANMKQGLFSDGTLSQLYGNLVSAMENTKGFLPIFNKLHIETLHQIYEYLIGIYTALNMTHIDDLESYITLESLYGMNKKTLIINRLIDVIEAQLNQALRALMPKLPENTATHIGMSATKLSAGTRTDLLMVDMERVVFSTFGLQLGITADQWQSVYNQLNTAVNQTNNNYLTSLQEPLKQILIKINEYLTTSMLLPQSSSPLSLGATVGSSSSVSISGYPTPVPSALSYQTTITKAASSGKLLPFLSLFKQLSSDEHTVLIDALDLVTAHLSQNQQLLDATSLEAKLQATTSVDPLTVGEYNILVNIVRNVGFAAPVNTDIKAIQAIFPDLASASPTALSPEDRTVLNGVIAYLALEYEKTSVSGIIDNITAIQKLLTEKQDQLTSTEQLQFKQLSGLSAVQKGQIQIIATDLKPDPTSLSNYPKEQQTTIAQGLIALGNNTFYSAGETNAVAFTTAEQSLLSQLGNGIQAGTTSTTQLNSATNDAYTKAINAFAAFNPGPFTIQDASNFLDNFPPANEPASISDPSTPPTQAQIEQAKQNDTTQADALATASKDVDLDNYIEQRTPSELVVLLAVFQSMGNLIESRIRQHEQQALSFSQIFSQEPNLQRQLFGETTFAQYQDLINITYAFYPNDATKKAAESIADLTDQQRTSLGQLCSLLVIPTDKNAAQKFLPQTTTPQDSNPTATPTDSVKHGFLEQIESIYLQDPLMQALIDKSTPNQTLPLQNLLKKVQNYNFKFTDLTADDKTLVEGFVADYVSLLQNQQTQGLNKVPSSQTDNKGLAQAPHPPATQEAIDVEDVASMLHAYTNLKDMQNAYVNALGQYLNFFTPYTATLNNDLKDAGSSTASNQYLGLTEFSSYAQSISQALEGTPLDTLNPPLFFYNKTTLKNVDILPVLAKMVEGTQHVPLPTFGLDAATSQKSSDNYVTVKVNDSATGVVQINVPSLYVQQTSTSPKYSPKFFFKDENGNPFANRTDEAFPALSAPVSSKDTSANLDSTITFQTVYNKSTPWLMKQSVPAQDPDKNYTYIYLPSQKTKPKGQEGVYVNIPVISQDMADKTNVLVRLYEQKIVPQPDWLNSEQGVITMLRVCLGDFASALVLDDQIFDPCLQYIYRKSLSTLTAMPNGLPKNTSIDMSASLMNELSQSCQLLLIQEYAQDKNLQDDTTTIQEPQNASSSQSS